MQLREWFFISLGNILPSFGFFINTEVCFYPKTKMVITDKVWSGTGTTILQRVKIGYVPIVAADAVAVIKDVPAYTLAAGIPARVVKKNSIKL